MKNKKLVLLLFLLQLSFSPAALCSTGGERDGLTEAAKFMRFVNLRDTKALASRLEAEGVCNDFLTETRLLDCFGKRGIMDGDIIHSDVERAILSYQKKMKIKPLKVLLPDVQNFNDKVSVVFLAILPLRNKCRVYPVCVTFSTDTKDVG